MEITKILNGPILFWSKTYHDSRGFFKELYNQNIHSEWMPNTEWLQVNFSSTHKDCIRGLHYREAEEKFVTVIHGEIYDVLVDIRPESNSFGKWMGLRLETGSQIYIPSGFAHGFAGVSNSDAEIMYLTNKTYDPNLSRGIAWDDPDLGIQWNVKDPILSDQDKNNQSWKGFLNGLKG